jgi:molybdopterin molybdotransferase
MTQNTIKGSKGFIQQQHIRRRGEDVAEGELVGEAGLVVTPARLNLLAQAGPTSALVHRRPRVAIVASGDELRELGEPLGEGDIVNSNAHAIAAAVVEAGGVAELLGIARDTLEAHVRLVEAAAFADVLITIGGVSAGTHDFVRPAFEAAGVVLELWKVAMRPGKPLAFGRRGAQLVFGLPGNPVSSQVTFELFVRPALLRLQGRERVCRSLVRATVVAGSVQKRPGFAVFSRASCRLGAAGFEVRIEHKQGSGQVSGLARANALCALDAASHGAGPGDEIQVLLLGDDALLSDSRSLRP